ncbi:SOS-induced cell division inhibitor SulA [Ewingella sp. AOP8-B2-18]|uniref:SOS-induced cell division inhibitor SulA n=1 Tax=Ewingella americana TaxID=41202 RepID=UPI00163AF116|nr:SOS-induced cell division inhibitor SulA [Ewingella americana]NWA44312.1 cell division inhibitor SulA [Pseudomonas reactans]QMV52242.1 cell division inhibitor SulA [Ewingella americana]
MRTQALTNHHLRHQAVSVTPPHVKQSTPISRNSGLLTEFVYCESQPALSELLLPVLQHLGLQSRWLLWLTPQQKLSRNWLSQSGLPVSKIVQVSQMNSMSPVDAMEKALLTGNYSVVLGWLPDLNDAERERLRLAALQGGSYGFIMRPTNAQISAHGQQSTVKIQSSVYH